MSKKDDYTSKEYKDGYRDGAHGDSKHLPSPEPLGGFFNTKEETRQNQDY
jgi:hypothetical protein